MGAMVLKHHDMVKFSLRLRLSFKYCPFLKNPELQTLEEELKNYVKQHWMNVDFFTDSQKVAKAILITGNPCVASFVSGLFCYELSIVSFV